MRKILLLVVLLAVSLSGLQAQTETKLSNEDPYAAAVVRFMKVTNVRATCYASLEGTYMNMKAQLGMTDAQVKDLAVFVTDAMYDDMVKMYVSIYRKYYTLEDLTQLCEFYETPLGQKYAAATPSITQEGMANLPQLMAKLTPDVQEYIQNLKK